MSKKVITKFDEANDLIEQYRNEFIRTNNEEPNQIIYDGRYFQMAFGSRLSKERFKFIIGRLKERADFKKVNYVAKLVTITLTTRVVVDEDWSDEEIINSSEVKDKFLDKIHNNEINENLESIELDTEFPYDVNQD